MENPPKTLGEGLRRLFTAFTRRPMGWNLIDAFTRLEEREEALREKQSKEQSSPRPDDPKESK
jgi:hypothetical protein